MNGLFPRFPKDVLVMIASLHSVPFSYLFVVLGCLFTLEFLSSYYHLLLYSFISPSKVT